MAKQQPIFPLLLTALPVGLILGGLLSFVFYFAAKDDPEAEKKRARERQEERQQMLRMEPVEKKLVTYIRLLGRVGPRNAEHQTERRRAADALGNFLGGQNMGYNVERQTYNGDGTVTVEVGENVRSNLFVELPGQRDEIILLGASYESLGVSPGADGNASGVAALLSVAHALVGTKPEYTLRFVLFADREGAAVHARQSFAKDERIVTMIGLQSLGFFSDEPGSQKVPEGLDESAFPDTANFVAVLGNLDSFSAVEKVSSLLGEGSEVPVVSASIPATHPIIAESVVSAFWPQTPAVLLTGTGASRNPAWGTAEDLPASVDTARLLEVTKALYRTIEEQATPPVAK